MPKNPTSHPQLLADSQRDLFEKSYEERVQEAEQQPVECLGMTFTNDAERRDYFLTRLEEGLRELHDKLSGVPFTTVDNAVEHLASVEKWPMAPPQSDGTIDRERLRETAEQMLHAEKSKDMLQRWKDVVGFPHGDIRDILRLSDPPYYTACPNPFLNDFIDQYAKPYNPDTDDYSREPFAADVSEGKNDPIYNAHSYHTKVPPKAIMRYILHYTEPGDLVFDGFAGTGMTGVAAQHCGDKDAVESLGYKVAPNQTVYEVGTDEEGSETRTEFSKLGARKAILNDLCPSATFIAYNYNTPVDVEAFEQEANRILREVEEECGWMYETYHTDGKTKGRINYTVWSDVYVCPDCAREVVFWEAAVDKQAGKVMKEFPCPHCNVTLTKKNMERAWVTNHDRAIDQTIRQAKQVPVLISYSVNKKRYEKKPDDFDLNLIDKIQNAEIPYWFPTDPIPQGDKTGEPHRIGITHAHHFYTKRNLWELTALNDRLRGKVRLAFQSVVSTLSSRLVRYNLGNRGNGPLSGTLYVSSLIAESRPTWVLPGKVRDFAKAFVAQANSYAETKSTSLLYLPPNTIDYIFTDPPFGGNLMYSELNFLWEAWLQVFTNNKPEAISNNVQGKGLVEYQHLMSQCFAEYYRVLKPGRWMTVEFHNSKNSVWNSIQEGLQAAGFVIADVRTLDKQQGSFKQVTSSSAVKQDLIISAYKPNGGLEHRFQLSAGTEDGVWDFIRTHLKQLPVAVEKDGRIEPVTERQNYLLFDRMVAFHVERGVSVPMSAAEFYAGLSQRFPERDSMFFLPDQVAEYDRKRMKAREVRQLELFVSGEASAIQWLRQQLERKPQTFQEIHPEFLKATQGWQKNEKPLELSELLEQNFLCYEGGNSIPHQLVSWMKQSEHLRKLIADEVANGNAEEQHNGRLDTNNSILINSAMHRWYVPDPNEKSDLEKLRERALLKEFEEYRQFTGRRLKQFRLEAVRAGFKRAWQNRDYQTIIDVAEKIPDKVLQEDSKLLMWYDQAVTRMGAS